jgi:hypothetical protein
LYLRLSVVAAVTLSPNLSAKAGGFLGEYGAVESFRQFRDVPTYNPPPSNSVDSAATLKCYTARGSCPVEREAFEGARCFCNFDDIEPTYGTAR